MCVLRCSAANMFIHHQEIQVCICKNCYQDYIIGGGGKVLAVFIVVVLYFVGV